MNRRDFLIVTGMAGLSTRYAPADDQPRRHKEPMQARPQRDAIKLKNLIPDTVDIAATGEAAWRLTQRRTRGEGPAGGRPHDYAQAATWIEIANAGDKRTISIDMEWIDFRYMVFRKWGYLKNGAGDEVLSGQIAPGKTTYRFDVPLGVSQFGPIPWYGIEEHQRFLQRIQSNHPLVEVRSLGRTKQGRDIRCLTIGEHKASRLRPNVLIVAREHGGESSGSFAVEAIVDHILSADFPGELRDAYCYHVVPMANPDGVANGTKLPQPGPIETSDLHYAGMTAQDPTCVAMREETLRLRPACYLNYHSYLLPMPQVIFYGKEEGMIMLDHLIRTDSVEADAWYVMRQVPGGHSTLCHCYQTLGTIVGLIELPWAGRKPEEVGKQGVRTFCAAMAALRSRGTRRHDGG